MKKSINWHKQSSHVFSSSDVFICWCKLNDCYSEPAPNQQCTGVCGIMFLWLSYPDEGPVVKMLDKNELTKRLFTGYQYTQHYIQ